MDAVVAESVKHPPSRTDRGPPTHIPLSDVRAVMRLPRGSIGNRKDGCDVAVDQELVSRVNELERQVRSLEDRLITREVLDDELRSLESRMREVKELTEG
jgi:hypothetical protein